MDPEITAMKRVQWRELGLDEPLQCGDMWASTDPNTPEKQTGGGGYNLQMQAVNTKCYGSSRNSDNDSTNLGNGSHWRPIGIVNLTLS